MSTASNDPHAQRLENLEVKLSYAEDALDKLDAVVARQQTQIDALIAQVLTLKKRVPESGDTTGEFRSLRDDLPPHY
ncbi:MAG: SlyX family protein [Burkholderiaceae bacterium]|jgi:SlyX protein|nr:SlyX family protein [Burkholderiaceae bacterium]